MQSVYHLGKSEEESPRVPTTFVRHEKLYTIYGTICIVSIRRKSFLSLPSSSAFFALVARLHFTSRFLLLCCCSLFITFDTHTQKHAHSYTHTHKKCHKTILRRRVDEQRQKVAKISTQLFCRHFVFIVCRLALRERERRKRVCILCGTLSGYLYLVGNSYEIAMDGKFMHVVSLFTWNIFANNAA